MMSNDSPAQLAPGAEVGGASRIEAFTFGEPAPVMKGELLDYVESWLNGKWYDPPLSWSGLAKSFHASPHHASTLYVKRNVLASTFVPHKVSRNGWPRSQEKAALKNLFPRRLKKRIACFSIG